MEAGKKEFQSMCYLTDFLAETNQFPDQLFKCNKRQRRLKTADCNVEFLDYRQATDVSKIRDEMTAQLYDIHDCLSVFPPLGNIN